jgi:D-arabinose 1-dehydrogenase-like Zn-dependent alcohol dehydrogenase
VTVISTSPSKEKLAKELGAQKFVVISEETSKENARTLDFIINTVSAVHKLQPYLQMLKTNATMCLVGIPSQPYEIHAGDLLMKRIKIGGSIIGGIAETQEMLNFCGRHNITSMIELVPATYANKAMKRLQKNDVKFRFVLDIANTLTKESPEVEDA